MGTDYKPEATFIIPEHAIAQTYTSAREIVLHASVIAEDGSVEAIRYMSLEPSGLQDFEISWILYPSSGRDYFSRAMESREFRFSARPINSEMDAKAIYLTLKKINDGMRKIEETEGYTRTFGQMFSRICRILKIKRVAITNPNAQKWGYGDDPRHRYYFVKVGQAADKLDNMVGDLRAVYGFERNETVQEQETIRELRRNEEQAALEAAAILATPTTDEEETLDLTTALPVAFVDDMAA